MLSPSTPTTQAHIAILVSPGPGGRKRGTVLRAIGGSGSSQPGLGLRRGGLCRAVPSQESLTLLGLCEWGIEGKQEGKLGYNFHQGRRVEQSRTWGVGEVTQCGS